jgi:hypothetical protein
METHVDYVQLPHNFLASHPTLKLMPFSDSAHPITPRKYQFGNFPHNNPNPPGSVGS